MKIRFFLFGTQKEGVAGRLEPELKFLFSEYLTDNSDVQSFSDIKEASSDIAKAVSDTHVLVFIADCAQFGATKLMLSKAFGFELSCDVNLLQKACEELNKSTDEEDYEFSVTHAFVPSNSRTFVLGDGQYAGFSVANGNQTIILIPYEKERTSVLLSTQVVPYINASYHISVDLAKLKTLNSDSLLYALQNNDTKIAVSGTNTATFFKEYVYTNESLKDFVLFSPIAEKRGDMQPVDYIVNLSITAAELMGCKYGAAMSNAFYTGDSPESEKIVYLAVCNERETAVREVHSFKGEDIPTFLTRCSGNLCVFISDVLSNDGDFEQDFTTRENAAVKRYKIAIAAVSAVIVALLVFCASYFATHDYSLSKWGEGFIEWIFPAGNPFEGLFSDNLPDEGELSQELAENKEETSAQTDNPEEPLSSEETSEDNSSENENQSEFSLG